MSEDTTPPEAEKKSAPNKKKELTPEQKAAQAVAKWDKENPGKEGMGKKSTGYEGM